MFVWQIPKETKKKAIQKSKDEEAKRTKKGHSTAGTSKNTPKNCRQRHTYEQGCGKKTIKN